MELCAKLFWVLVQGFIFIPTIAYRDTQLVSMTPRRLGEPQFEKPIGNHTFHIGREAMLGCSVVNLGKHKVGWLRAEDQTVLSLHDRVVLAGRYAVTLDAPRTWQLRIRPLRAEDRGCYMCQINTQPSMKWQIGCIDVYVPPDIINEETSADVAAQELENVTLVCKASGHPPPKITWRREDHEPMLLKKNGVRDFYKVESYVGSSLPLWRVDRRQMGAFLCIASNDVPPAVSKRITLLVNWVPMHMFPNRKIKPNIFKAWVEVVEGKVVGSEDYEFYEKKLICDIHFTSEQKNRNQRLNALAVPVLNLPRFPLKKVQPSADKANIQSAGSSIENIIDCPKNVTETTTLNTTGPTGENLTTTMEIEPFTSKVKKNNGPTGDNFATIEPSTLKENNNAASLSIMNEHNYCKPIFRNVKTPVFEVPPTVMVPNQLLGAPLGTDVVLECTIEAHPNTINYWLKNRGEMLLDGPKYTISEERSSYKVQMTLVIRSFTRSDIGTYNCVSTNSLGKSEGTLRLYEIKLYPSSQSSADSNLFGPTDEAVKLMTAFSVANSVIPKLIIVVYLLVVVIIL